MEINRSNDKLVNAILFCIGTLLLLYTTARAYLIDITWDEASTYMTYVRNGTVIIRNYDIMSANNHILNTILLILFTKTFGATEFVMRIPSLIAHLLFLFYSAKLLKNLGSRWLIITSFIVVNVNPYMLDFFSLARGYGLSIGLMTISIYYFYRFQSDEKRIRSAALTIFFAGLAVLANFVLLNYCLVVYTGIIIFYIYFASISDIAKGQKLKNFLKGIFLPSALMLILLLLVIPIALKLKNIGALFFGGDVSFWKDTIGSITDRSFYELGYSYALQQLTKGLVVLTIAGAAIYVAYKAIKKQLTKNTIFLISLLFIILLCSLSTIIQFHLFATPYLMERTALFLVVLFSLIFVFFISELVKMKNVYGWLVHVTAVIVLIHFALAFNLKYVLEWKLDSDTKEMLSDLDKIKKITRGKETVSLGISLIFEAPVNYYRQKENMIWLNPTWRFESRSMLNEYFFMEKKYVGNYSKDSLEIIKTYPITGNVLAKAKYIPGEMKEVFSQEHSFHNEENGCFEMDSSREYAPDFSYIVSDSITPNKKGILAFYAEVMAPDISCDNIEMVLSFRNKNGKYYKFQRIPVKDFIKREKDWFRAGLTCVVPDNIKKGDEAKAFFWNKNKERLYIQKAEFKWLEPHY